MSASEHEQLPPIATIPDVVEALRRLGVGAGADDEQPVIRVSPAEAGSLCDGRRYDWIEASASS